MSPNRDADYAWLRTGEEAIEAMLAAIDAAKASVRLEMYIFHDGPTADEFRDALVKACQRGVRVRVLLDGLGSAELPESFWKTLREHGGEFRWFNPLNLTRVFIRDHRKVLVCDEQAAYIGGFNIATEYRGDGVHSGWCDLGLRVSGPLALELAAAFDDMFACADFKHKPFTVLRKSIRQKTVAVPEAMLLLGGPGRNDPLKRALREDLRKAREVRIVSPYFLPPWKLRRMLLKLARRGAKVQLILPAKCDLPLMRLAARSYYRRFLKAGVEIWEYQPQILHAKLFIIDDVAYAGSANLDGRSLRINYELLVRLSNPALVREGRQIFDGILAHCRRIDAVTWRDSRTLFDQVQGQLAHWVFSRMDGYFSRRQLRRWILSLEKAKKTGKPKTG